MCLRECRLVYGVCVNMVAGLDVVKYLVDKWCYYAGQLVDVLRAYRRSLSCELILQIFNQTCAAVQQLHRQQPPIIHRDLKVGDLFDILCYLCYS